MQKTNQKNKVGFRICLKCKKEKHVDEFYKDKRVSDRRHSQCKKCILETQRLKRKNNPELIWSRLNPEKNREIAYRWANANSEKVKLSQKKYNQANKEKIREKNRKWNNANKKRKKELGRRWREDNEERVRELSLRWQKNNPEKAKEANRKAVKKRDNTPKGILNKCIRNGIIKSLNNGSKNGRSWELLVGYTAEELKKHIEKQFKDGMTWENKHLWQIDHILPISIFNYKKPEDEDFKRCWALKNLQPLWSEENNKKKAKFSGHFQPSLIFS